MSTRLCARIFFGKIYILLGRTQATGHVYSGVGVGGKLIEKSFCSTAHLRMSTDIYS